MKKVILSFAVLAFTLTACNDKKQDTVAPTTEEHAGHEGHGEHATAEAPEKMTTVKESNVLQGTLDGYFKVKVALQEDNQATAGTTSTELVASLTALTTSLKDATSKELVKELLENASKIEKGEIKVQREAFEELTEDLVKLINIEGTDRVVFEQYCPMYNNGEGGDWLSDVEPLSNPLYGSSMLKCGATKNKITFETK